MTALRANLSGNRAALAVCIRFVRGANLSASDNKTINLKVEHACVREGSYRMRGRGVYIVNRLVVACVILLGVLGIALVARHIEQAFAPTAADAGQWATIPEMPNLPEPSVTDYPVFIGRAEFGNTNSWQKATGLPWEDHIASLRLWDQNPPNVAWLDDLVCSPTALPDAIENPPADAPVFDVLDMIGVDDIIGNIEEGTLVLRFDEEQEAIPRRSIEPPPDSNNTALTTSAQGAKGQSEEVEATPGEKTLVKIRTKLRRVEAVLKNAVIEPYTVSGKIEGLRVTGLEKIRVAKNLGLQSGDIIRAVNGQRLDNPRKAYEIFKAARKQLIMKVEILRDGKTKTLLFYLR